jgi:cation diffusion facilitator CzcD-associated flavoprotein CzcO
MPSPTVAAPAPEAPSAGTAQNVDIAVVGAGFAGLYLFHRLRKAGFATVVLDETGDVGGTWYWNRYPGARCDVQTIDYSYTFDPDLEHAWTWSERYATQPEILRYLSFVADRYDLRRDIRFHAKVMAATWDQADERWLLTTDNDTTVSCRYYIMATGCLSSPKPPEIAHNGPVSPDRVALLERDRAGYREQARWSFSVQLAAKRCGASRAL